MVSEELSHKIDLSRSRLKPYQGFIFLCGGKIDVTSQNPVSIRDAILRGLVKNDQAESRIRLAEHYKDWANDSVYTDLVSFESHLAELSSVIVLALESPGSIAELGLFSVVPEFQKKLLVFIETRHYQSLSFIRLGPIDYLEKSFGNDAECHRWTSGQPHSLTFDSSLAEELQNELASAVLERARDPLPECQFNRASWLHQALLICDIIGLYSALTLREIKRLLTNMGFDLTETSLRQFLFVLDKVGLIKVEPKGHQRFYVGLDSRKFLRFHFPETTIDLTRFQADQLAMYRREDIKRFRAVQDARSIDV